MFHGLQDLSKVITLLPLFSLNTSFLCSPRSPLKGARTFVRAPRVGSPPPRWVGPGGSKPYRFHGFEPSSSKPAGIIRPRASYKAGAWVGGSPRAPK